MTDIETPLTEARTRYRALHRRRRRLTPQERVWYYSLRYLQHHTEVWRRTRKALLVEMADTSLAKLADKVQEWKVFHDWLVAQEAQVSGGPNRATFQLICGHVDDDVERVTEVLEDFNDEGENVLVTIIEAVTAAGVRLGLEPYDPWEDADDGAVWFLNPDTGNKHYFLLGQHHDGWKYDVMSRPIPTQKVERGWDRWEQFPGLDLSSQVLTWSNPATHHPARWLDAYFGAWNGLNIVERDLPEPVDRALGSLKRIRRRTG